MKLTVNGDPLELPAEMTVLGLIQHLSLDSGPVAVERNREIVPRAKHAEVSLSDGDELEIVHFVGGG
ncbi:MAG: hypothetical protein RJA70_1472 [Pseudomonadota bacterium]|jgi:sulfur carrier protein